MTVRRVFVWPLRGVGALAARVLTFARWSLSAVEDHDATVVVFPGTAHGPVPSIELRTRRRRT